MYDLTDSWTIVKKCLEMIDRIDSFSRLVPLVIVGNKKDQEIPDKYQDEKVKQFAGTNCQKLKFCKFDCQSQL